MPLALLGLEKKNHSIRDCFSGQITKYKTLENRKIAETGFSK
jgi:hypothetical protein